MRVILGAGAALALFSAAPLAAAQTIGTVDITGSVAERCEFTIDSGLIALGELSGTGGTLDAAVVNFQFDTLNGWCNGTAAEMTVEAHAIENLDFLGAPPAGFERVVNYTAEATASTGVALDSSTTLGAGAPSVVGVFSSDILVLIYGAATPGGGKLIAGDYAGSVDVTLTPNP